MAKHGDPADAGWRQFVLEQGATTLPAAATAADFAPTVFHGNREPRDIADLLSGVPLVKMTALSQRARDLHLGIPSFNDLHELRLTKLAHSNRISHLTKHKAEGGFGLDPVSEPQVIAEKRKLERAERELARQTSLQEIRTTRWNNAGQLERGVMDWLSLGGVPGDCVITAVEDAPLSELLTKADDGRIEAAVERNRLRQRELAADRHRVNSAPHLSSDAKAAAREFIDRLCDQGQPNLDDALEHGQPISFATKRLQSQVLNVVNSPGAIAFAEAPDAIGLLCWMFRDQLQAKINAGFDEIADDSAALSLAQRAEIEAQINLDMLAAERAECGLIWIADSRGEVLDFRPTTSPQAVLGVRLVNVTIDAYPPSSPERASYDLAGGGRR